MGMLVEGDNLIRDFWSNLVVSLQVGTGDTQETSQDTGLESPVSASVSSDVSTTKKDQFLLKNGRVFGVNGGGESSKEMVWIDINGLESSRITFPSITYDGSGDIVFETRWYFRGRKG